MKYCDSCLIIAYDNVGADGAEQDAFLDALSGMAMLEDHICDRIETDGEITCNCKDHE
tara:strand:+ start:206 stop:379 length:174 start_codon:yes stop_codon:yes gene_type:complete